MLTLEGTLNSIWNFFSKLFFTFLHSLFRPRLFIRNLRESPQTYVSAKTYLFIGIFTNYFIFRAFQSSNEAFLGFLDIKYYQEAFSDVKGFTVLDIILASAPYAVITYGLIILLIKCLNPPLYWKDFFKETAVYFFASTRILFCFLLFGFILGLKTLSHFVSEDGESPIDQGFIFYFFISIGVLILSIPVIRFQGKLFYPGKSVYAKFLLLLIIILSSSFLNIYPFYLGNKAVELVLGKPGTDKPIRIYNDALERDAANIYYYRNSDSTYQLTSAFIIENKSSKTCYFRDNDIMKISFKLESKDCIQRNNQFVEDPLIEIVFRNDLPDNAPGKRVQIIKTNDYLNIAYSTEIDTATFNCLRNRGNDSISVYSDLGTLDPNLVSGLFGDWNEDVGGIFSRFQHVHFIESDSLHVDTRIIDAKIRKASVNSLSVMDQGRRYN